MRHSILLKYKLAMAFPLLLASAPAQEADSGLSLPITFSAGAFFSGRLKTIEPDNGNTALGFRALFSPAVKLSSHWFFYSGVQVNSNPYFYYDDSYYDHSKYQARLVQAFLAYTRTYDRKSIMIKAGRLSSAFGAFPLRYDDAQNPLLDEPMSYGSSLKLRPDQIPCGAQDFLPQRGAGVEAEFHCGGSRDDATGLVPVTLYGLPGIELDAAAGRLDARLQISNSSPANPQSLLSTSQTAQWTAGAGYTIHPGFRVGASMFRGPFLSAPAEPFLPRGRSIRDFPATAAGLEAQWAWRRLSAASEWQRFQFDYPNLSTSPALTYGYAELKAILTPRLYAAGRFGLEHHNRPADPASKLDVPFLPAKRSYEMALGFRPNRWQLVKVGYEWRLIEGFPGSQQNVLAVQYVTSFPALSRAFRSDAGYAP
jgi:hypothetical protein